MAKSMVIVESPAKARTIGRYLGKDFVVRACAGHIKDLPKKKLGVDIEDNFRPTYEIIAGKEKIIRDLRKIANKSDTIYLAADPDREGEAICQHLAEELAPKNGKVRRVLFNEITKNAIHAAFDRPGEINRSKVAAQQARRILDRLVGYQISPLLWKKVRRGLSAGRVQSVALRLIVDRELEIRAFVSDEYWNFGAELAGPIPPTFEAKAIKLDGKKFKISNQSEADQLLAELKKGRFTVTDVRKRERKRNPVPPFVTSKLQQEASRKLRFTVKKTMAIAQRLYEGKELGDSERVGLITYMRTDSTRVGAGALEEVRSFIESQFGKPYLPSKARSYRSAKGAQDAHEAIRPTSAERRPEELKQFLDRDEFRLYDLIWKRFTASQMNPALFDQTEIDIEAPRTLFRSVGSILRFDGFLKVYQEGRDDSDGDDTDQGRLLPPIENGTDLDVREITSEQKFTQPPPRYSEANLVKALEEKGIGRPSTYSQIITVIQDREYVEKNDKRRFEPTETGEVVSGLLVENFEDIFSYDYTARLERDLDEIENGKDWVAALQGFYKDFSRELKQAQQEMKNLKQEETPAGIDCEKCGSPMVIKWGRFGRFIACKNFPECRNTQQLQKPETEEKSASQVEEIDPCEKCGQPMARKKGRYGEFLACTGYPECKNTRRLVKVDGQEAVVKDELLDEACPECSAQLAKKQGRYGAFVACSNYPDCRYIKQKKTGVDCPDCKEGDIVEKKSRRGKLFYSCNRYPKCKFVLWKKPLPEPCPQCENPYLLLQITKKSGTSHICNNPNCDFKKQIEAPE